MKIRLSFALILIGIFCSALVAQSVVITGKKVAYTRKKPISDYKKTFTINYPEVKASTPALSKKIENAISYGINLKEEIDEVQWLEEADYEVGYNQNGILCIALNISGSGAYPSDTTKYVSVNLRTGNRIRPADVFTNLPGLLKMLKRTKDFESKQTYGDQYLEAHAKDDPDPLYLYKDSDRYHPVKADDFSVAEEGVTFHHDYGFPHVALAYEPKGEFWFTWKQLKPYIKRDGLLGQFVR